MSYFKEIDNYATYSGAEADFHFIYNANSGGGQAFLAGRFYDGSGQLASPESLNGKIAEFAYKFHSEDGEEKTVLLNDAKAIYEIKPRGAGSTSMKLSIGSDRVAPSKLVSAFMMLPPTCGVKMPNNLQISILSSNNYWLQSMWLDCSQVGTSNDVQFTVKDCVFGGGLTKGSDEQQDGRYFQLDVEKRMSDIVALSARSNSFCPEIASVLGLFADVYLGQRSFSYDECNEATKSLMEQLALKYPAMYSGITDPLPAMFAIADEQAASDALKDTTPVNNEADFKVWLSNLRKTNGEPYSEGTRGQYVGTLNAVKNQFATAINPYNSVFSIDDAESFDAIATTIRADSSYDDFNRSRGNGSLSAGLELYSRFLHEKDSDADSADLCIHYLERPTGYTSSFAHNRILFGAPGTGKSFTLNREKDSLLSAGGDYERVTFHPDYSYANFIGTYKPVPSKNSSGEDSITYSFVPGPFMRIYTKAVLNSRTDSPKPFLLIIEEINRANVAAVFGDIFQLLDRGDDNMSEYPIQASEDIKKYLADVLGGKPKNYSKIQILDNMFIWATMNSADQGVFPMDTAFKRRWDFTYLGIDDGESGIAGKKVILGRGEYRRIVDWNSLRKAINGALIGYKVNEDKLMGPYFIAKKHLPEGDVIDSVKFAHIFKNKVIMYLFDDAARQKRSSLFSGCEEKSRNQYSRICEEFDNKGVFVFCEEVSRNFIDKAPEVDEG